MLWFILLDRESTRSSYPHLHSSSLDQLYKSSPLPSILGIIHPANGNFRTLGFYIRFICCPVLWHPVGDLGILNWETIVYSRASRSFYLTFILLSAEFDSYQLFKGPALTLSGPMWHSSCCIRSSDVIGYRYDFHTTSAMAWETLFILRCMWCQGKSSACIQGKMFAWHLCHSLVFWAGIFFPCQFLCAPFVEFLTGEIHCQVQSCFRLCTLFPPRL